MKYKTSTSKPTARRPWALHTATTTVDGRKLSCTSIDKRKAQHDLYAAVYAHKQGEK